MVLYFVGDLNWLNQTISWDPLSVGRIQIMKSIIKSIIVGLMAVLSISGLAGNEIQMDNIAKDGNQVVALSMAESLKAAQAGTWDKAQASVNVCLAAQKVVINLATQAEVSSPKGLTKELVADTLSFMDKLGASKREKLLFDYDLNKATSVAEIAALCGNTVSNIDEAKIAKASKWFSWNSAMASAVAADQKKIQAAANAAKAADKASRKKS